MRAGRRDNKQQDGNENTKREKSIISLALPALSATDSEAFADLQGVNKGFLATEHGVGGGDVSRLQCREVKARARHINDAKPG